MKGRLLIDVSVVSTLLAYHFNGPPASLLELAVVWCGSRCAAELVKIAFREMP